MITRDLFISHSSADASAARELRAELEEAGYTCWMAPDDITGNETWAEQILGAIEQCRAMIVLVSAGANASSHVSREVSLALGRKRALLPIRIEAVTPQGPLEYLLSLVQRVDAFPPPIASHRDRILKRVETTLGAAATAPGSLTIDATAALGPGSVVDDFTIEGLLGEGGMATVYRARQSEPRRAVALKVVRADRAADASYRRRFLAETETLVALEHPSIVPIYDAGDDAGRLYLAMRLVDGMDLQARIARDGSLSLRETTRILEPIADAIDHAHASGIVHRDLKPSNILLDASGRPYLTDFGLGKRLDGAPSLSDPGLVIGTLGYMAPEQFQGDSEAATAPAIDIYALACVAYICLTGTPAFPQRTVEQVVAAKLGDAAPGIRTVKPDLPPGVDQVIARGMAKDPAERFGSARELVAELVRVADTAIGPETLIVDVKHSTSPVDRALRWFRANTAAALLGTALALVGVVVVSAGVIGLGDDGSGASPGPGSPAPASSVPGTSTAPASRAPSAAPASATPPPDIAFPSETEAALLRTIPILGPREGCRRWDLAAGDEAILEAGAYDGAIAGIACPASNLVGDTSMIYHAFFDDDDALAAAYGTITEPLAGANPRCAKDTELPGTASWFMPLEGKETTSGSLACFASGDEVQFVWTHTGLRVLAQAARDTNDLARATWERWATSLSEEEQALRDALPALSTPSQCGRAAGRPYGDARATLVCPGPGGDESSPIRYALFASKEDARAAYTTIMTAAGYPEITPEHCYSTPPSDGSTGWGYLVDGTVGPEQGMVGCHDETTTWAADSLSVLGEWTGPIEDAMAFFDKWIIAIPH